MCTGRSHLASARELIRGLIWGFDKQQHGRKNALGVPLSLGHIAREEDTQR